MTRNRLLSLIKLAALAAPLSLASIACATVKPETPVEVKVETTTTDDAGKLLRVDNAVTVVHLSGTPAQIGHQHGELLKERIGELIDGFVLPYVSTKGGRELFDLAGGLLEEHLSADEKAELDALAAACGRDRKDLLLLNTFLDVAGALSGREGQRYPFHGSTMAVDHNQVRNSPRENPPGSPMLAGTIECEVYNEGLRPEPVVFAITPKVGKPYATVALPGMLGAMAGTNHDGVSFFSTQVKGPLGMKPAVPFAILCRRMMATADSSDSAAGFLVENPVTTTNNVLLADAAGNVRAVECSAERIAIRKNEPHRDETDPRTVGGKHVLSCAMHFVDPGMASQQCAPSVESAHRAAKLQAAANARGKYLFTTGILADGVVEASVKRDVVACIVFRPRESELYVGLASSAGGLIRKVPSGVIFGTREQ